MRHKFFLLSAAGFCLGIGLKLFVIDFVKIRGDSMEPSLKNGSFVFINKLAYGIARPFGDSLLVQWAKPQKGDILTFIYAGKPVVKRCAGLEEEPLDFSSDSGYSLRIGGLSYPLTEQQYQRIKFDTVVPKNTVLVLGDNSKVSVDSRNYGFVPTQNILAKVMHR